MADLELVEAVRFAFRVANALTQAELLAKAWEEEQALCVCGEPLPWEDSHLCASCVQGLLDDERQDREDSDRYAEEA